MIDKDISKTIKALENFRAEWSEDITNWWDKLPGAKEVLFILYDSAGSIILALQQIQKGCYKDKLPMMLAKKRFVRLIKSESFDRFSAMNAAGMIGIFSNKTNHHIRVMSECFEFLTK